MRLRRKVTKNAQGLNRLNVREVRLNDDGTLDEIVTDAVWIHIEQMSDENWWMMIDRKDGSSVTVNFWTPRTRIRAHYLVEGAGPSFGEGGEFGSDRVTVPDHPEVRARDGEQTP